MDDSLRVVSSMAMDHRFPPAKMMGGSRSGDSNLIRQSSSPARFLSYLNAENDYGAMGGMRNFGGGNVNNAEASSSSSSRLKVQMAFSPGPPSSSGRMATIPEGLPEDGSYRKDHRSTGDYIPNLPIGSWDDSAILSGSFLEGLGDDDRKPDASLNTIENQNEEGAKCPPTVLSHHLSLPQSAMEKFLQFEDSVPCRIRAKRGCATHPRSIAERVRRTRISERMKKLQELVPNMDKQTNTADMLDLAVDYIKDLQRQVKTLSANRAQCNCFNNQNQ